MKKTFKTITSIFAFTLLINAPLAYNAYGANEDRASIDEPVSDENPSFHVSGSYFGVAILGLMVESSLSMLVPNSKLEICGRALVLYPSLFYALTSDTYRAINRAVGPVASKMYDDTLGPYVDKCLNRGVDASAQAASGIWKGAGQVKDKLAKAFDNEPKKRN